MKLTAKTRLIIEKAIDDIIVEFGEEILDGHLYHLIQKEFRSIIHDRRNVFMSHKKVRK
jgi:hypothetical protein